uniref:NADH-ubiquinone oxidoreductase chain 5 n=1 Tax=Camaena cicatricosa TaxID=1550735 RepID=A0A0A0QNJ1_CAMCI|nr:NADH dehydrogenase subunit 5 [Camaena cicatricosa]AIS20791.1 NADH dehydrogenase subunit 5 [Camaena cicatricosa]
MYYLLGGEHLLLGKLHKQRLTTLLFITAIGLIYMSIYFLMKGMNSLSVGMNISMLSSCTFSASVLIDKVSLAFSSTVTLISACVFMFSRHYMQTDAHYWRFTWILLLFVLSMNFLIYAGSLLMMLVGWDGLGITSFLLIIYYQSASSWHAGFLTLLINRIGDILIMASMYFFVLMGFSYVFNYSNEDLLAFAYLLGVASLTKSAQYPFSVWLPAAMAAPTPVSALVHSSTLVTAGIYIMIRFMMTMNIPSSVISLFLFCGSITSLVGGVCAFYENDIKKIVAYSTLSQLGIMVFSLGLNAPSLALLHLFTHAMFKAMLFLVAGAMLLASFGVQDIRLLGSITKSYPLLMVFFNMSTLCLLGLPFLSAYYSKHAIITLMWADQINLISLIIMLIAVTMTSAYMLRALKVINWTAKTHIIKYNFAVRLFYLPYTVLFMGSMTLGWLFELLDNTYVMSVMLPTSRELIMLLGLMGGVLFSMMVTKRHSSFMVMNMFYMRPLWSNVMFNKVSILTHKVELGWVEPNYLTTIMFKYAMMLQHPQWWPSRTMSFWQYTACLVTLMYWLY